MEIGRRIQKSPNGQTANANLSYYHILINASCRFCVIGQYASWNPSDVNRLAKSTTRPLAEAIAPSASKHSSGANNSLPLAAATWIANRFDLDLRSRSAEWSADEVFVSRPRAGGDAWVRVTLPEGSVEFESTDRGWISLLNDLHKGRNTGGAWSWFIDLFAVAILVFCLTGFFHHEVTCGQSAFHLASVGVGIGAAGGAGAFVRSLTIRRPSEIFKKRSIVRLRYSIALVSLVGVSAFAAGLFVSVDLPRLDVAEYHRPYVVMWIEGANREVAANLAVWYDFKPAKDESAKGTKYLKDLRKWWRRTGRELQMPVDAVAAPLGQRITTP